jgi:quercetin dioxygenase-like cupin family protein
MTQMITGYWKDALSTVLIMAMLVSILFPQATAAENDQSAVQSETLLRSSASWDGEPYKSYASVQPEISILKITVPPRTKLEWHSHPIPSAAYMVAGELTVERQRDGKRQHFSAGQAISETVDTLHRGIAGNEPVVLIVFYAGGRGNASHRASGTREIGYLDSDDP